jgi:hypothetical protein
MTRKLFLLAGLLMLTVWASSAPAHALGNCTCTFCFPGSSGRCLVNGEIWTCTDYRLNYC